MASFDEIRTEFQDVYAEHGGGFPLVFEARTESWWCDLQAEWYGMSDDAAVHNKLSCDNPENFRHVGGVLVPSEDGEFAECVFVAPLLVFLGADDSACRAFCKVAARAGASLPASIRRQIHNGPSRTTAPAGPVSWWLAFLWHCSGKPFRASDDASARSWICSYPFQESIDAIETHLLGGTTEAAGSNVDAAGGDEPATSETASNGDTDWHPADTEPPAKFQFGPLVGQKKQLARWIRPRNRRGETTWNSLNTLWWGKKLRGQEWEVWFLNELDFEAAKQRSESA